MHPSREGGSFDKGESLVAVGVIANVRRQGAKIVRPNGLHLCVAVSIVCMPLAAQEPRTETGSGVAEHFTRCDRDGNRRSSASQAGKADFFRRADVDDDGVVTLAEAQS